MRITNRKLLPLVTALCVLVFTAVSCRHNVVLQELLRNRNKRTQNSTFPEAYYVRNGGTGDGTAYSTPFGQLIQALNAARDSGGKTNRVIVIGSLTHLNADGLTGGGGQYNQYLLS